MIRATLILEGDPGDGKTNVGQAVTYLLRDRPELASRGYFLEVYSNVQGQPPHLEKLSYRRGYDGNVVHMHGDMRAGGQFSVAAVLQARKDVGVGEGPLDRLEGARVACDRLAAFGAEVDLGYGNVAPVDWAIATIKGQYANIQEKAALLETARADVARNSLINRKLLTYLNVQTSGPQVGEDAADAAIRMINDADPMVREYLRIREFAEGWTPDYRPDRGGALSDWVIGTLQGERDVVKAYQETPVTERLEQRFRAIELATVEGFTSLAQSGFGQIEAMHGLKEAVDALADLRGQDGELEARAIALSHAAKSVEGWSPDSIVQRAAAFYAFLTGQVAVKTDEPPAAPKGPAATDTTGPAVGRIVEGGKVTGHFVGAAAEALKPRMASAKLCYESGVAYCAGTLPEEVDMAWRGARIQQPPREVAFEVADPYALTVTPIRRDLEAGQYFGPFLKGFFEVNGELELFILSGGVISQVDDDVWYAVDTDVSFAVGTGKADDYIPGDFILSKWADGQGDAGAVAQAPDVGVLQGSDQVGAATHVTVTSAAGVETYSGPIEEAPAIRNGDEVTVTGYVGAEVDDRPIAAIEEEAAALEPGDEPVVAATQDAEDGSLQAYGVESAAELDERPFAEAAADQEHAELYGSDGDDQVAATAETDGVALWEGVDDPEPEPEPASDKPRRRRNQEV